MTAETDPRPLLRTAFPVWARIGMLSFGGPAAQIALMHREVVEARGWLTEREFLNATGFCMLLPGPEAMQIATYAGWRLNGVAGGLVAGGLFVLPGAAVILALALLYVALGTAPWWQAIFLGVQAAVIAIVVGALWNLAHRALDGPAHWVMAAAGFVALFVFALPFPLVIALAAATGALLARGGTGAGLPRAALSTGGTARTVLFWLALWAAPLALLWLVAPQSLLLQIGLFFSKLAVVTFGGAYAVLAYMAQDVVTDQGWLTAEQMIDGLGLAETTPGPLILVTEFVGFVAGANAGGIPLALAAAALTLWVTFVPCFLWIFALAPYVDWVAGQPRLKGALEGITATVVGVIANLSLWFALHVLFDGVAQAEWGWARPWVPDWATLDPLAAALAVLATWLLLGKGWPLLRVLGLGAAAGLAAWNVGAV